jgi:hypothetical protein
MSRSAKVAEAKAQVPLKTMTLSDGMRLEEAGLNAIQNIVIAEIKDHADRQLLGHRARRSGDSKLRDVLKPAVDEVDPKERQHLSVTAEEMARPAMTSLTANSQ